MREGRTVFVLSACVGVIRPDIPLLTRNSPIAARNKTIQPVR